MLTQSWISHLHSEENSLKTQQLNCCRVSLVQHQLDWISTAKTTNIHNTHQMNKVHPKKNNGSHTIIVGFHLSHQSKNTQPNERTKPKKHRRKTVAAISGLEKGSYVCAGLDQPGIKRGASTTTKKKGIFLGHEVPSLSWCFFFCDTFFLLLCVKITLTTNVWLIRS